MISYPFLMLLAVMFLFLIWSNIEARRGCWFIEDESAASIQIFEGLSQILRVMCIMGFEFLFRTLMETHTQRADVLTLIIISKKKGKNISREICIFNLNWNRCDIFLMVSRRNWKVHKKCSRKIEKLESAQNGSAKLKYWGGKTTPSLST